MTVIVSSRQTWLWKAKMAARVGWGIWQEVSPKGVFRRRIWVSDDQVLEKSILCVSYRSQLYQYSRTTTRTACSFHPPRISRRSSSCFFLSRTTWAKCIFSPLCAAWHRKWICVQTVVARCQISCERATDHSHGNERKYTPPVFHVVV